MLASTPYRAGLLVALFAAASAPAAVHDVTVTGATDNTEVIEGDPCGTGMSGPNACNNQEIVVEWRVDDGVAPADAEPSPTYGRYQAGTAPLFLTADVTINGVAFPVFTMATLHRFQSAEILDEINSLGITDGIRLELSGGNQPAQSSITSNVLLGQTFSGDALAVLGGSFAGPPVIGGASGFLLENAFGRVTGQYVVQSAVLGAPEPMHAAQGLIALAALAWVSAARSARAATRR